ncbi:3-hydroxyacyl-CoA dehydrogenase family protein [Thermoflavifilum thermophilum]|uniref:3-hydroxybutyryl-CoA dehydrogenase n=1 Tax=Thermoflavifilum thermophilum TaxID=1393122 RepID=A0A1I7NLV1_9BACT|nr:3-hydroxyacyl-CoA dehydrogenase NAD-binding domain-containing protein [Thermoflavifilum thermophilum]SFV35625.1 3-hydroxybutyryl-CoA dehydrogenase [Thermoflavifilum thermophilum]
MKYITVIGAGTMGNGIAHVFAQFGFEVNLVDVQDEILQKALQTIHKNAERQVKKQILTEQQVPELMSRIHVFTQLPEALQRADLVVEAATEKQSLKEDIFRQMDQYAPAAAILASNTSSISITRLAAVTNRPRQVIGMHFMNPVPVMPLVEVIQGFHTDPSVTDTIVQLSRQLGKTPCVVNDYPGFVSNRILMPMLNEAIYTLQQGVAGVEEIDTIMKLGMGHPMGPLQLADFIGLDVCLSILQVLHEGLGDQRYAPCPLLVKMVHAGCLGVKTGEGFYRYAAEGKEKTVNPVFQVRRTF